MWTDISSNIRMVCKERGEMSLLIMFALTTTNCRGVDNFLGWGGGGGGEG